MALWPAWGFALDSPAGRAAHSRRARSKPARWRVIQWQSSRGTTAPNRVANCLPQVVLATQSRERWEDCRSLFVFPLMIPVRVIRIHSAVAVQTPQMNGYQPNNRQRQNHHVQHVKAQQRVRIHGMPAEQNEPQLLSDKRRGRNDAR